MIGCMHGVRPINGDIACDRRVRCIILHNCEILNVVRVLAMAKILFRKVDHRANEIDSDCRVSWCLGWLEKRLTI